MNRLRFHHFAWGLLVYTMAVVLWGAFVRASFSGDGCGNNWPHCHGQLLPPAGDGQALIEWSHRLTSGLLLPLTLGLLFGAFRATPRGHVARKSAAAAVGLTLAEGAIGAGLVLYQYVAHDRSASRAVVMPAHLVTTFLLLMALTLTAWWSSGGRPVRLRGQGAMGWALGGAIAAALLLGVSGAITALGDMLYPAHSLAQGIRDDFTPSAHLLVSLRLYHPLIAMCVGLYLLLVTGLTMRLRPSPRVELWARATLLVFMLQLGAGLLNLTLLAPVWMQVIHLFIADLFWVCLVLMAASALAEGVPQVALSTVGAPAGSMAGVKAGAVAAATLPLGRPAGATWRDYLALTKPRVISLLLFTTVAGMWIAAGGRTTPGPGFWVYVAVAVGFYMAAGSANAINMVLERDLDLAMGRTAKRPTVTETIPARAALQFALLLMTGSFLLLWSAANLLSAMLAMAGLAFYVVIYTVLLKRRTWWNIVIGGAAGAFPPLVGWAAVTGDLSALAWCLFGIIFLWTPVHFWALAIMIKDDYARAGVPMLPVVRGVKATVVQIGYYTLLTVAISVLPMAIQGDNGRASVGWFYVGAAVLLNAWLLVLSLKLYRKPERRQASSLFHYSMLYLALLFLAMAIDRVYLI
jgi:heme o synthase